VKRCVDPKDELEPCHVGLWNIALPIKIKGQLIGTLISGQRRSTNVDRDAISKEMFEEFVKKLPHNKAQKIWSHFENTKSIDDNEFNEKLLKNLTRIQGHIYKLLKKSSEHDELRRKKVQNLAHEFLLPIQSIIADSENLYNELTQPELKDIANEVLQEMQKLAIIAENMRGSLFEAKEQDYHFNKHNLYKCIIGSVELFQKEANKKSVRINRPTTIDNRNFPVINMSFEHLERAFANLIHNAVKYSYSSSPTTDRYISILGEPQTKFYCVTISNFGLGILQHEITSGKIWEDGYRGELSADRNRTGSGMGLFEVKKIVEKHGGKLEIQSEPKGGPYKTTVKVYLPYFQETSAQEV
jgi:signal transduction histidine kinase